MRLAIVGAGMAGLAAAHRLQRTRPDIQVVIFEQGSVAGGRAATRRRNGAIFDHGAQYLKTPTPELQDFITRTLAQAAPVDIDLPVWTFDASGRIAPGDPAQNAEPKWTFADGLDRLAEALATGIHVRYGASVGLLELDGAGYRLLGPKGEELAWADAVLLTPPAPQTRELIERSRLPVARREAIVEELQRAPYRCCLTATLGYAQPPRARPFYALVNVDRAHPISWLAYEHRKPGRGMAGQGVLIAQMAAAWSRGHWAEDNADVVHRVAELVSRLLGEDLDRPDWYDLEHWQDALPDGGCDSARLHADDGLYFAGDYVAGQGRLHLALESGWHAAERIGGA
jgi:hypothetical protein